MHVQLAYMVLAFHFLTFVFIKKSNVAIFKNKEKEEGAHEVFFSPLSSKAYASY